MSYGGVGLSSVRGSGTSGYVTTNKFHLKASRLGPRDDQRGDLLKAGGGVRKPNAEILEHNRKRAVEVKLAELRDALEAKGCGARTALSSAACADALAGTRRRRLRRRWRSFALR